MPAIRVKNLKKNYGLFKALKGISFEVDKGEIIGFLGPNGAGKTTTMKILTCFMSATSGQASVASHDCFTDSLAVRGKIGYLPENNPLYTDMTVFEYLYYMGELHDLPKGFIMERIRRVIEDCNLKEKLNSPILALSKGFRQRVGLAATLIHDPDILFLDEPTVGLDPNQIVEIRNLIKKLGREKTVVISSHLLSEVEATCSRILIINAGEVVASGTPHELRGLVEGHANVKVVVRGDRNNIKKSLIDVSGVKSVKHFSVPEKYSHGFNLFTVKNRDVRPDIAKAIVENELELLEIHKEIVSLEEVFNQVTHK